MVKIKIGKIWNSLSKQKVSDNDGNVWNMAYLIDCAKDLEQFDIPMHHLCFDQCIGGMKIREFVSHMKNILEADMQCPIILDQDGAIFDGRHRIAKALLEGHETIKAVRFDEDPSPTYCKDKQ